MSLTQALNTAISGLNTAQSRIAITSSNISNVNTPGYSKKIAGQETLALDGVGAGVQVGDIYRNVNQGLVREMRGELGKAGREEVRFEFFQRVQTLFGTPQSDAAVSQRIADLADAFEQLGNTPEQNSPRVEAIESARQVMDAFSNMSRQIQDIRDDIDDRISDDVDSVNTLLDNIADLNTDIVRLKNLGQPTTEIEDQRDQKINALSKIIDVTTFSRGDGSVVLFTANGSRTLLDRTPAHLSFEQTAGYEPGTPGAGITINGTDITGTLRSGTLKGLFEMRDSELPALNDQIVELAGELRDAINEEHNKGTAFPPPANLSGNRMVDASDPINATGVFRIAALDANGNLIDDNSDGNILDDSWADIDLSTVNTVGDLVNAINTQLNNPGPPAREYLNARIVDGRMVIEGQNGSRISINEMTSQITTSDGRKQGMSHYFGLNDFIATPKRADTLTSQAMASQTTPLGVTANSMTISAGSGVLTTPGITINYAATDSLTDVQDKIRAALQTAGMTADEAASFAHIVNDGNRFRLVMEYGANMTVTDNGKMSQTIGLTEDQPTLADNMDVSSNIKNDPARIVRGQMNADVYASANALADVDAPIPNLGPLVPPPLNYTFTVAGPFTSATFNYDSNTSLQDIADAINNDATLTDNNITAEVVFDSSAGGYTLRVTDADGDPFYFQDSGMPGADSLTSVLGLGIDYGVHEGDNSAAIALSGTFERTDIDFESAGGLSAERTSLTDFAAGIVATAATRASVAQDNYEFQSTLVDDLSNRVQNEAGVNLDEEMADLIIFQRAYTASARVISAVDELFDALLNAV